MTRSISFKLALAFIFVAVLTATVLTFVFFSSTTNRFQQYVFDQQFYAKLGELESYYASNQSWNGVESLLESRGPGRPGFGGGAAAGQGQGFRQTAQAATATLGTPSPMMGTRQYALADEDGLVLVGIGQIYPQGEILSHDQLEEGMPIHDGNRHVGTLLAEKRNLIYSQAEQHFLDRTNAGLLWALLITVVLAAVTGFLLSRNLTKPVIDLTDAAQSLASGERGQKVNVRSNDELGALSLAFNQMSQEIEHSDQLRKRMTADIAHDLRTPLTVIGGYIESMRDGDLNPTPERLGLIYAEIGRLNHLVGDLRLLSQSDAGEMQLNLQTVDAKELMEQIRELFELNAREKNISLTVDVPPNLPLLMVDERKLVQVMENLVGNAIRHTPTNGAVTLQARLSPSSGNGNNAFVHFTINDSGEGIAAENLPYVFERFHRLDKSRHADENQSGLGLAIVKAIVLAHGGKVWVDSTLGKGTTFHFSIPVLHLFESDEAR